VLIGMALYGRQWWEISIVAALVVLIFFKHIDNIKRILKKEEARL